MPGFFNRKPTQADPNRGQFFRATVAPGASGPAPITHYAAAGLLGQDRFIESVDAAMSTARAHRNGSVSLDIPATGSGRSNPHG